MTSLLCVAFASVVLVMYQVIRSNTKEDRLIDSLFASISANLDVDVAVRKKAIEEDDESLISGLKREGISRNATIFLTRTWD